MTRPWTSFRTHLSITFAAGMWSQIFVLVNAEINQFAKLLWSFSSLHLLLAHTFFNCIYYNIYCKFVAPFKHPNLKWVANLHPTSTSKIGITLPREYYVWKYKKSANSDTLSLKYFKCSLWLFLLFWLIVPIIKVIFNIVIHVFNVSLSIAVDHHLAKYRII